MPSYCNINITTVIMIIIIIIINNCMSKTIKKKQRI